MIKTYLTIGVVLSSIVALSDERLWTVAKVTAVDVIAAIVVYAHSVIFWPWYLYCGWKRRI